VGDIPDPLFVLFINSSQGRFSGRESENHRQIGRDEFGWRHGRSLFVCQGERINVHLRIPLLAINLTGHYAAQW